MPPLFRAQDVYEAVSPERALEAVRDAFVAYAKSEWTMPPKVYVPLYPAGDFRAMPAQGGGFAPLKWISSFPGNPSRGLPTVMGTVLLSDASSGQLLAILDAGSLTALRTGAAAVLAAELLAPDSAGSVAVIGAGVNGKAVARTFLARGRAVAIHDVNTARAEAAAEELGAGVAASQEDAVAVTLRRPDEADVWAATRAPESRDSDPIYSCQATTLPVYTRPLPWWDVRQYLEDEGFEVYDFRNPAEGDAGGFHWSDIDSNWRSWSVEDYIEALNDEVAEQGFKKYVAGLEDAHALVMVLPCGVSAHLKLGWAIGSEIPTAIYVPRKVAFEPELIYKFADLITQDVDELVHYLHELES